MSTATESLTPTSEQQRTSFAVWLARQYLGFDDRLSDVIYLPQDAPDDEIRYLIINTGLFPEPGPITPLTTTPAVNSLPYRIVAADITPEEWRQLQTDDGLLPQGWSLQGKVVTGRKA